MDVSIDKQTLDDTPHRLSDLLRKVSNDAGERISLGQIGAAMADRSFGAFLVVFCLPNMIPLPPGATFVLGLPLVFIAFQMAFSRLDTIWLPKRLHAYTFDNKAFAAVLDRFLPWMQWAERFISPRLWPREGRIFERFIGILALVLAVIIFLPIPFGNLGPSYALALIGLGLTERDGILLGIGAVIGAVCSVLLGYIGYELLNSIPYIIHQLPHYWDGFRNFMFS